MTENGEVSLFGFPRKQRFRWSLEHRMCTKEYLWCQHLWMGKNGNKAGRTEREFELWCMPSSCGKKTFIKGTSVSPPQSIHATAWIQLSIYFLKRALPQIFLEKIRKSYRTNYSPTNTACAGPQLILSTAHFHYPLKHLFPSIIPSPLGHCVCIWLELLHLSFYYQNGAKGHRGV